MKLAKHDQYDIYTIQGTPQQQRMLTQHIQYANGCPAISPIEIDGLAYWHVTSLHRAGIDPQEFA